MISLGCPKNLVDSEGIATHLLSHDIEVVADPTSADVVIVNTCGFLAAAREESVQTLRRTAELKRSGVKALFVAGCMVQHYAAEIREAVPEVDRLVDFADYSNLPDLVDAVIPPPAANSFVRPGRHVDARLTPAHFAYLKISEGCNHTCSFCVIPRIRGRMVSFPLEELIQRAQRLADLGAREINVVAQDSTMYGIDLYGRMRIGELLRRVAEIHRVRWVRLLYAYPTEVDDALIETLTSADEKILPYIDVPLQHSSDRMLSLMNRKSSGENVEDVMRRLRAASDDMVIRTTFIVGFPGETEEDFEHLLDFVGRHRIDRLGAFTYSPEPGSAAFDLPDAVPADVAEDRLHRLMTRQHAIASERNRRWLDRTIEVLVEDPGEEGGRARGRSWADAPEIDGAVHLVGRPAAPGEIVRATVTEVDAYDMVARIEE